MTILCPVCATTNLDGSTYCEGCGVELTAAAPAASATPATTPETPVQDELSQGVSAGAEDATVVPAVEPTPPAAASAASGEEVPAGLTAEAAPLPPAEPVVDEAAPAEVSPVEAAPEGSEPEVAVSGAAVSDPAAPQAIPPMVATGPAGGARLGIKKFGAPTGEFIPLQGERLIVGRFDASSGPVDIDLSDLGGREHISRRHAELYRDQGGWAVRDLGSTNGVYIKRQGEAAFSPRLQEPAPLADGDELAFGNLMLTFHQS